jgi:hypothetical protein
MYPVSVYVRVYVCVYTCIYYYYYCPSLLEMVYLRVPPRHVRDFSAFSVCLSNKHCPSSRCANAANAVGKSLDIFTVRAVSLHSMQQLVLN